MPLVILKTLAYGRAQHPSRRTAIRLSKPTMRQLRLGATGTPQLKLAANREQIAFDSLLVRALRLALLRLLAFVHFAVRWAGELITRSRGFECNRLVTSTIQLSRPESVDSRGPTEFQLRTAVPSQCPSAEDLRHVFETAVCDIHQADLAAKKRLQY